MYVRTKKGEIFDCYESEQMHKPIYYPKKSKTNGYIDYEDVYKKSDNLIDILQVGDYVNGHYVEGVEKVPNEEVYKVIRTSTCDGMDGETLDIYKEEIESIVTKEQFSCMEYKIGDE